MIEGLNAVSIASLSRVDLSNGTATQSSVGIAQGQPAGPSFADILSERVAGISGSVREAEMASMKAMAGEMDVRGVTDAVLAAERNLQASVAIRDKIVTAYLDMSRMAI